MENRLREIIKYIGARKSEHAENIGNSENFKIICLENGFNEYFYNRAANKATLNKLSSSMLLELINIFKKTFESLGYSPSDFMNYMNSNLNIVDMDRIAIKYNLPLLDYAGVTEEALFTTPQLVYRNQNPAEIYAIIKWLKSSEYYNLISAKELDYYIKALTQEEKRLLMQEYPFTSTKANLILKRFETITEVRLRENSSYSKGSSIC